MKGVLLKTTKVQRNIKGEYQTAEIKLSQDITSKFSLGSFQNVR